MRIHPLASLLSTSPRPDKVAFEAWHHPGRAKSRLPCYMSRSYGRTAADLSLFLAPAHVNPFGAEASQDRKYM